MTPELGTMLGGILLLAFLAILLYFRGGDDEEKDTTQYTVNDVYFRRLFVPLSITFLIFCGSALIIRGGSGSPGMQIKF